MDGFDDEEWAEMQEMYIKFTSKELEKIQENMDMATMESLRTFGHNIKGSGGMYGFDGVTELGAKIEAAAKVVGGLEYNYAVKGDGQLITKLLPYNQQMKALNSLIASIDPKNLSLPESLIELIPPRAFGHPRTRETFRSRTGLTFDYLAAAETAANLTLKMLLNPERASRLLTLKARDVNSQPGLSTVIDKIIDETILKSIDYKKNALNNIELEISKMVNHHLQLQGH